jgi:vacuolar-type H+-ATPase subunit I/STV1
MELGCINQNNRLIHNGTIIGTLTIKDRIILSMNRANVNQHLQKIEKIRSLFAHRAEVAQKNYIYQREQQINQSKHNLDSYNKLVMELEVEKQVMQNALKRQKKEVCEALKEELIEAAINNGYEVEEISNKNSQVQLQLVRRVY